MGFFDFSPKVTEVGSYYEISGINLNQFELDLRTNFGTSVIFNRVVKKVNNSRFRIHRFFMVELVWVLEHFTGNKNRRQVERYRVGMYKYKSLYDEVKKNTWVKSTFEKYPPYNVDKMLKKFKLSPFPDQRSFLEDYSRIKQGYHLRGCLLDGRAGSGKTLLSLYWSEMVSPYKTIIIVPKHLVNVPWIKEMTYKYFKVAPKIWSALDGTNPLDHTDSDYFIIYKENLRNGVFDELVTTISKRGNEPIKIIIDESHYYNDYATQQTQGLIEICNHPYVSDSLFMSGTPIKAQGKETYSLFCSIDPYFDKHVRNDFLKMYGRDNSFLNEMLAHRLGRIKFTIERINGLGEPPKPVIIPVKFPGCEKYTLANVRVAMLEYISERVKYYRDKMPTYYSDWNSAVDNYLHYVGSDKKEIERIKRYREIVEKFRKNGYNNFVDAPLSKFCSGVEKDIEHELRGEDLKYFRHIKSAVKYLGLKIRGEALGRVLSKYRMEAVRDVIEHADLPKYINSVKKKTAIYTSYIEVIHELKRYFEKQDIKSISVSGENSSEVDSVIRTLETDKTVNPLITTYNTLREGYPLLMCNQLILMNSPFRNYELKQTIARIFRKGQDTECLVFLLDLDTGSEENITSRSIDIMEWSKEQVDVLLGGGKLPESISGVSLKSVGGFESMESALAEECSFSDLLQQYLDDKDIVGYSGEGHITKIQSSIADIF